MEQRATKNKQWIRVELPPVVIETLEILPPPKGARQDNRRYFYEDEANLRTLVKGAWRTLAAVFEQSGVNGAIPHRFRHTLASELLGKGGTLEKIAAILADSPATIRRYLCEVDAGVSDPPRRSDPENPRHRFRTDGRTGE